MKVLFILHGQPDYSDVTARGFIGHGRDLGSLTDLGKQQAEEAALSEKLKDTELIVSSPYTRALQTAAIISRRINVDINVELDLHEWLPDLSFTYSSEQTAKQAGEILKANKGICPLDSPIKFEELHDIFLRVKSVLDKYTCYKKIAVVAHGIVIRQFSFAENIPYCGISEIDYDENFKWRGFIEN